VDAEVCQRAPEWPETAGFQRWFAQFRQRSNDMSEAQNLLVPSHRPDVPGGEAEPEHDPRRQGTSPDPDGISFAEFLPQPPSLGGFVNKPIVVTKSDGAEERDRSPDKQLRADQWS
jgi:hypothetical protein